MALATQCPFCQTTFRVAQDQLKLRGGLVRCGNCKEVFNGNDYLLAQELAQQLVATTTPATVLPPVAQPATPATPAHAWPPLPSSSSASSVSATPSLTPASATASARPPEPPVSVSTPVTTPATPAAPAWAGGANLSATFASIAAETNDAPWGLAADAAGQSAPDGAAMSRPPAPAENTSINTLTQALSFPVPQTSSAPQEDLDSSTADAAALEQALNALAADTGNNGNVGTTTPPPGLLKTAARNNADAGSPTPAEPPQDVITATTALAAARAELAAGEDTGAQDDQQSEDDNEGRDEHEDQDEGEEEEDAPGFVQRAERRERLRRVTRVVMAIGAVLLTVSLLLQALFYWRNQVAAWLPATRPLLSTICARLHCTVGLPANIEQLSLESNELQQAPPNPNMYTLTVLLRNRSASAQSWPYMELTLNDNDERAITRRVFTPHEYLASVPQVNDGFAGNSEQQVKLTFQLAQPAAAGYRIYLFYP